MSAPVRSCPLLSAQLKCNSQKSLKSLGQPWAIMGLITRRSQVQILAPLQSFRVVTARGGRFRRPSFKMRNERGTEQRANGQQRPKSALTALHLQSELVAGPICPLLSARAFLIRMRDVPHSIILTFLVPHALDRLPLVITEAFVAPSAFAGAITVPELPRARDCVASRTCGLAGGNLGRSGSAP